MDGNSLCGFWPFSIGNSDDDGDDSDSRFPSYTKVASETCQCNAHSRALLQSLLTICSPISLHPMAEQKEPWETD
jgi:hypothetical protein